MTTCRLVHSGISSLLCYSAFFAFMVFRNYPSAILAVISALSDNIAFFFHYLYRHNELQIWYSRQNLRQICRLGIVIATIGLLNLGFNTTLQVMLDPPLLPIADSKIISIIWSVICLRSGIFLMYYCISYQNLSDIALVDEEVENPQSEPASVPGSSNVM